jgi:hypothetical protein
MADVDRVVQAVNEVEFLAMRREVARALASLADLGYQRRAWLAGNFGDPHTNEDLTLNINILYDDSQVLPNPTTRVGSVLIDGDEVEALTALERPLSRVLDRLGEASDAEYMSSPEWLEVVQLAGVALAAMVRRSGCI